MDGFLVCGIAAIFAYSEEAPPVQGEELLRIRDAMTARGPDGEGLWLSRDGRVGLAHRRLAIIDLSNAGAQPMANEAGDLILVFNGEIYNYQELRARLESKGYVFRSHSDTEVLLHLYAHLGEAMVHELRGMFAFAIWDENKQGLFLARDPFGIKPLYYADDGATFRVASQVKALLAGGQIDRALQPAGHVGFFLWGSVPEPYTLYKNIMELPAGTSLWIDRSGKNKKSNFCLISRELGNYNYPELGIDLGEVQETLRDSIVDSIKHHLIADVPVGIFLSSGLDSITLTALASEIESNSLNTITLVFEEYKGTPNDESPIAESIAQYYHTKHQSIMISLRDFQDNLEHLLNAMDQPSVDGVNTYFVSKIAAESGLKVAISGLGGDELFGGYPSFSQIPQMVKWVKPTSYLPLLGKLFRGCTRKFVGRFYSPKYAGLLEYGGSFGGAYLLRRSLFMPWELEDLLDGDLVREGWQELQTLGSLETNIQGIESDRLKVSALEMSRYMRNQLLRDSDWASMAHSLEIRVPLVDIQLLRNVIQLLASSHPPNKKSFARTPKKPIPTQVLNRKKTGFSIPVQEWLLQETIAGPRERGIRAWAKMVYREALKIS
jgi:asparagine synthase (glutamine-hydrolysing)